MNKSALIRQAITEDDSQSSRVLCENAGIPYSPSLVSNIRRELGRTLTACDQTRQGNKSEAIRRAIDEIGNQSAETLCKHAGISIRPTLVSYVKKRLNNPAEKSIIQRLSIPDDQKSLIENAVGFALQSVEFCRRHSELELRRLLYVPSDSMLDQLRKGTVDGFGL